MYDACDHKTFVCKVVTMPFGCTLYTVVHDALLFQMSDPLGGFSLSAVGAGVIQRSLCIKLKNPIVDAKGSGRNTPSDGSASAGSFFSAPVPLCECIRATASVTLPACEGALLCKISSSAAVAPTTEAGGAAASAGPETVGAVLLEGGKCVKATWTKENSSPVPPEATPVAMTAAMTAVLEKAKGGGAMLAPNCRAFEGVPSFSMYVPFVSMSRRARRRTLGV
mmetsp:Transcript_118685/g.335716  ORF Transcript_118685/g.335716 Transcript_118685/m.335716 type:complete len:223 (+) Transcript_118685:1985-2653(+)